MQQTAHFQMPFLLAGEVLNTAKSEKEVLLPVKDGENKDRAVGYTVMVTFPNGSNAVISNVVEACMFGGIGDFFQSRLRASGDVKYQHPEKVGDEKKTITTIGSRVLVAFVGGDMRKPVIVGHLPHPQRNFDIPDSTKNNSQSKLSYKGFEVNVDSIGQIKFVSRGGPDESNGEEKAPKETYKREDKGPVDLPDRETNAPLPSTSLVPNKPPKQLLTASLENPIANAALTYPDKKYTSEMGFLELGEWYVVDSEGQIVLLDRDSKTLSISNGTETIQLDKAHKKVFIQSSGDLEVTTQNDYCTSVTGNKHQTIKKNEWYAVKGDEYRTVGGSRTSNVVDKDTAKIGTSWNIDIGTAESVSGGSGKSGDKHRASIKLSTGNSFVMDDDTITVTHKSGALISIDKDGLLKITAKKDIEVTATGNATVTAKKVDIKAGEVNIGEDASFSAVLGENLAEWLDQHMHPTGTGPSGPAMIPTSSFTGSPKDILSAKVKLKQ